MTAGTKRMYSRRNPSRDSSVNRAVTAIAMVNNANPKRRGPVPSQCANTEMGPGRSAKLIANPHGTKFFDYNCGAFAFWNGSAARNSFAKQSFRTGAFRRVRRPSGEVGEPLRIIIASGQVRVCDWSHNRSRFSRKGTVGIRAFFGKKAKGQALSGLPRLLFDD